MSTYSRAPHVEAASRIPGPQAPNAALLIDFDNVTMGMRSDLSKELRNLLNSDVIKGKVAVQRAYADWRRYPQYIVPLAENSVDLIFAPAYGSSKKNATDIRMAIDGMELIFTRPEIGTFILLTGDSDFSSLVLKLKEYGKYVIGVGIQESSSDLLVQNCDEYYSYTALTGLRRAGEAGNGAARSLDPWQLAERSIEQMIRRRDVMRSDRLKQVMLELDPSFDEGSLGFSKFSRFISEAASRGIITTSKLENGQYEVGLPRGKMASGEEGGGGRSEEPRRSEDGRRGREPRGGGRDATAREPEKAEREEPAAETAPESAPTPEASSSRGRRSRRGPEPREAASPAPESADGAAADSATDVEAGPSVEVATEAPAGAGEAVEASSGTSRENDAGSIDQAWALLRQATEELTGEGSSGVARDSDVKRRMLVLEPGFDEDRYGFPKFSRFLQKAKDTGMIDLRKNDSGVFELSLLSGGGADEAVAKADEPAEAPDPKEGAAPDGAEAASGGRSRRGRGSRRGSGKGQAETVAATTDAEVETGDGSSPDTTESSDGAAAPAETEVPAVSTTGAIEPTTAGTEPAPSRRLQPRTVRKGRGGDGPPPLLAGQGVPSASVAASAGSRAGKAADAAPENPAPSDVPVTAAESTPEGSTSGPSRPSRKAAPTRSAAAKQTGAAPKKTAPAPKKTDASKATEEIGRSGEDPYAALPVTPAEQLRLLTEWKGVGKKTAETLIEAFGPELFPTLDRNPRLVRETVPVGRAELVIEGWLALRGEMGIPEPRTEAPATTPPAKAKGPAAPRRRAATSRKKKETEGDDSEGSRGTR